MEGQNEEVKTVVKNMSNNQLLIVCGIAVVAIMLAGFIGYNIGRDQGARGMHDRMEKSDSRKEGSWSKEQKMMERKSDDPAGMSMDGMTEGLKGLSGDVFDKAFIEMMIVHHQGALDMAKLIPENAKHAELKKLGQDIIKAQTKEIEMMQSWLKSWGYQENNMMMPDGSMMNGMDHEKMMQGM